MQQNSVLQAGRKIDGAVAEMRATREAAEATQQRFDAIVELAARGELKGGGGLGASDAPGAPEEPKGKPSVIAGKTLYPRNPGWTVLCDSTTNADPKRDLEPKGWNRGSSTARGSRSSSRSRS